MLAPIVLFVYNRPEVTLKTLEHLKNNILADKSELYIYCDGPKNNADKEQLKKIKEVREIIRLKQWCKTVHIIEAETNKGLANSIINGVSEIVNLHEKVIVLEDDLLTSIHYLEYMNEGLERYKDINNVFQIVGYTPPVKFDFKNETFFLPFTSTLGWGTWKRAWACFEKDPKDYTDLKTNKTLRGKFDLENSYPYSDMLISQMEVGIDSWGIRWWWSVFKKNGISLFPDRTLVAHIGFGSDASHTKTDIFDFNKYWLNDYRIYKFPEKNGVNRKYYSSVQKHFRKEQNKFINKIKRKSKKMLKKIFLRSNPLKQ